MLSSASAGAMPAPINAPRTRSPPAFDSMIASGSHGNWNASMYQLLRAWLLRTIDAAIARGWGVDSEVSDSSRSGWASASAHPAPPPQSCPST